MTIRLWVPLNISPSREWSVATFLRGKEDPTGIPSHGLLAAPERCSRSAGYPWWHTNWWFADYDVMMIKSIVNGFDEVMIWFSLSGIASYCCFSRLFWLPCLKFLPVFVLFEIPHLDTWEKTMFGRESAVNSQSSRSQLTIFKRKRREREFSFRYQILIQVSSVQNAALTQLPQSLYVRRSFADPQSVGHLRILLCYPKLRRSDRLSHAYFKWEWVTLLLSAVGCKNPAAVILTPMRQQDPSSVSESRMCAKK